MDTKNKNKKAVLGIYLASKPTMGKTSEPSKLVDSIELDSSVRELRQDRTWRSDVKKHVEGMGYDIVVMPMFIKSGPDGIDVAITVTKKDGAGSRLTKPVTVGRREIGKPLTGRKTMATLRRGNR